MSYPAGPNSPIIDTEGHAAIATGPRSFAVLERDKLTSAVAVGDRVKARVGPREITIETRANERGRERYQ